MHHILRCQVEMQLKESLEIPSDNAALASRSSPIHRGSAQSLGKE
jgi:hypothetical protein